MKRFFLVSIVLALFGIAANAQPTGLVGTWKGTTMDLMQGDLVLMSLECSPQTMQLEFTFKADNTVTGVVVTNGEKEVSPTMGYKVDGNDIIVIDEDGGMAPFRYENGKLTMRMQQDGVDITIHFQKK